MSDGESLEEIVYPDLELITELVRRMKYQKTDHLLPPNLTSERRTTWKDLWRCHYQRSRIYVALRSEGSTRNTDTVGSTRFLVKLQSARRRMVQ